ncbi:MAG: glycogen debranching protein [Anaerolineae bacterium]|nr:glycogen debranching protein [Anaerolineae bacterium]
MVKFYRETCNDFSTASRLEWLVTNGLGSYASGTVAGVQTRRYHGLLIAALRPPLARTLLLEKFDETAQYAGKAYPLFTNHWATGEVEPHGYQLLNGFHLDGTTPVWEFSIGKAILEKRVWMQPGKNTTYIQYRLTRANAPLELNLKAIVNYRDHHQQTTEQWTMGIEPTPGGIRLLPPQNGTSFVILSDRAIPTLFHEWYKDYYMAVEAYRGLPDMENHLHAATFTASLQPGETLTLLASTEAEPSLDSQSAWEARQSFERALMDQAWEKTSIPDEIRQLTIAADQFIVNRPSAKEPNGKTIIAGYHWFEDWGRDTMIALPGLTLTTNRLADARSILRTFSHHVSEGMLPNRFPEIGETPEYNTVDATLWYFEAIRAFLVASDDDSLLEELYPTLVEMFAWHERGTRFNIHVDQQDGLIYAGEPGVQLTWMDAKVGDWVVTPRIGKPVEINALWYNATRSMADFAHRLGKDPAPFISAAEKPLKGLTRFWNSEVGYCFDVIDGPNGYEPNLRPNQLFAVSLFHSPLSADQQRAVVDICAVNLYTPYGLRSLAPEDPNFIGTYGGDQRQRDAAYHQGTVWGWLMGPFISAHLRVYKDSEQAMMYLAPLLAQIQTHGVGTLSEVFEGDAPFPPRGCIAQAWSVAEALRVWQEIGVSRLK